MSATPTIIVEERFEICTNPYQRKAKRGYLFGGVRKFCPHTENRMDNEFAGYQYFIKDMLLRRIRQNCHNIPAHRLKIISDTKNHRYTTEFRKRMRNKTRQ